MVEHGRNVGAQREIPLLSRELGDAATLHLVGGVVDQDVQAPELVRSSLDQFPAMTRVGNVARSEEGSAASGFDDLGRLAGV
jgi:hypothetical protein